MAGSDSADARPLDAPDFAALLDPLLLDAPAPARIAVACSGGPDSMALAWLAQHWCRARGVALLVLIVDHALRPESAAEAELTQARLAQAGIPARILTRSGDRPTRNLQAAARAVRHALLAQACRQAGIAHLLLAHHLEDQAETVLLRLARGSGVEGLAAMAARRKPGVGGGEGEGEGPVLLRPLLTVPRARLAATLQVAGLDAVNDPSNRDRAYARVRLRALAPILAAEGLTAARLAETARHMAACLEVLDDAVAELALGAVRLHPAGYATFRPATLAAARPAVAQKLLARLLAGVAGADYPPRFDRLERLLDTLGRDVAAGRPTGPRTLGGCRLGPARDGWILLCREARAAAAAVLPAAESLVWDGRFRLILAPAAVQRGCLVRALGGDGMAWLRRAGRADRPDDPPGPVRASLPVLADAQGHPLAVPHLDWAAADGQHLVAAVSALPIRGIG